PLPSLRFLLSPVHPSPHSVPTRRSSDLVTALGANLCRTRTSCGSSRRLTPQGRSLREFSRIVLASHHVVPFAALLDDSICSDCRSFVYLLLARISGGSVRARISAPFCGRQHSAS